MLTCVCWKWGGLFAPVYVNRLRSALARQLQCAHELVCVTDDPAGIDGDVRIVTMPTTYAETPRCRRRMQIFDREFARALGSRLLCLDLDLVLVDDITPLVRRPESLVCWKVRHAGVYSGSFILMDAGVLDPLWRRFAKDPEGYPRSIQPRGTPSDQAMVNAFLRGVPVPCWTEADGFVTYFGAGYERLEQYGVGPTRPQLPAGARVVVLGSADKRAMDEAQFDWIREHWR